MNRFIRRWTVIILSLIMLLPLMHMPSLAANPSGSNNESVTFLSDSYSNWVDSIYPPTYGERRTSFINALPDGGYQTAIYDSGIVYIESFDSDWNSTGKKYISLELPTWGGFYFGENYNYIVCGQPYDPTKTDGGEVYRIIKYSKDFQRLGSVSFTSSDTYTAGPFTAGNVSVAEHDNLLTVYTSRQRLDSHQSNIALYINTDDMTVDNFTGTADYPNLHVSHSFRQLVKYDGETAVYVDLSDGYPVRSVYLQAGDISTPLVNISGQIGDNITHTEVSGLEISDTHYFVIGSCLNFGTQNIYLSCIEKNTGAVTTQWLTASTTFSPELLYAPRIVKIANDRFVAMWNSARNNSIQYVILNSEGTILCSKKETFGIHLTDCEPIFSGEKIVWLSVASGVHKLEALTDFSETGTFVWEDPIVKAVNPWDGTADTSWYNDKQTEFYISTPQQLAGLSELATAGNTFAGRTIYLTNDIFMNDDSYSFDWEPISNWEGTFHGKGNTIYNMCRSGSYGGLFDTIGESGIVKAVELSQGLFYGGGCIADTNHGIIAFCNSSSLVCADSGFAGGGICNTNYNLVYGCKNLGTVSSFIEVGGIVGENQTSLSVVSQCGNLGVVESTHSASGIISLSHGWVYNCYSRGYISGNIDGNPNTARHLAGIIVGAGSYEQRTVESCYAIDSFHFVKNTISGVRGIYSVAQFDSVNCYCQQGETAAPGNATSLTLEQMRDPSFVDLLNKQTHTMLPAWVVDKEHINDGYPITVADYNSQRGIYKIQPELWIGLYGTITLRQGDTKSTDCNSYYNEEEMIITVSDSNVASFSLSDGTLIIKALSAGETCLNIHFNETENVMAADYQLKIVVEPYCAEHTWGDWNHITPPTCTESGLEQRICTNCDQSETRVAAATGHHHTAVVTPATCTQSGYTTYTCICGDSYIEGYTDPLGHRWGQWIQTIPPSEHSDGENTRICTTCFETQHEAADNNPFTDVTRDDQFETAILWAYYKGVTKGTSATEFSPEESCTRKQIVTFLWRAAGQPEPASMDNPFTDVTRGDQFEKAILWAYYKGITKGTSATRFSPDATCTRKQIVTFLWRYHDNPDPQSMENPFVDVTQGDQFEKAILWAYYSGVTKGTSSTNFSPENPCTRKQIVTFLYRNLAQ